MARPTTRTLLLRPLAVIVMLATAAASLLAGAAQAHPDPASIPYRWELDFKPGPLRLYVDPIDGAAYWYFTYQILNRTGSDQVWAPTLVLFTDAGEILASGREVRPRIEESIRELLGNPLMETQNEIIGDLLQGREHARDGLVVWPAEETAVNEMSVFIGGLSGETARVRNPSTGEEIILRKTLQRDYLVRGDALARGSKPVELRGQRWVLR
ncbi:MAG: hypothetical protein GY715_17045 [Planctomycetes bacterium]|nr:hypothetical protein [Planctomycetota bacterium]